MGYEKVFVKIVNVRTKEILELSAKKKRKKGEPSVWSAKDFKLHEIKVAKG